MALSFTKGSFSNGSAPAGGAGWSVATATDATHGQDAFAVHVGDGGLWVVVADGATGRPDGAPAARIVVDTATGYLVSTGYRVEDGYGAVRTAEQALRAAIRAERIHPDAATTLTIVGVTESGTCLVTRGDSPVWWLDTDGLDAWGERDASFVTGIDPGLPLGAVGPALAREDLLIVATDGVVAGIPDPRALPAADDPAWTPAGLAAAARRHGSVDDITVVTIRRPPATDPDTNLDSGTAGAERSHRTKARR